MATVKATQKYVRQTPRKLRAVADLIRGRELPEINDILSGLNKRGARVINETIRQAVANAVNNMGFNETQLSLKSLMINEGPTYKRFRAGSRGRAKPYEKKTSHVMVELAVREETARPAKKAEKAEAKAEAQETATKVEETPAPVKTEAKKPAAKKATKAASVKEAAPKAKKAAPKKKATKESK